MGLIETLGRIPKIMEANVNALLDKCEDPKKMIDQTLIDYKRNLAEVKQSTTEVMANLNLAKKKLADCDAEIARATLAAENALKAGNEQAAMQIIATKQQQEQIRTGLAEQVALNEKNADQMRAAYNKLVNDITLLEQRRDIAKAKIDSAKAQQKVNKATSTVTQANQASETLTKYEQMADKEFAKAQAEAELDKGTESAEDLISKYSTPGGDASVSDELAAMKARLGI